jgi:hypothetical protein
LNPSIFIILGTRQVVDIYLNERSPQLHFRHGCHQFPSLSDAKQV